MSLFLLVSLCLLAATLVQQSIDEDAKLFADFQNGDHHAFEQLLKRHERGVVSFIYRQVGDRARAQELGQETFLRVIRNAESWTPKARFRTWLFTIARNLCIDEARRARHRHSESLDENVYEDDSTTTAVDRVQDLEALSPAQAPVRAEFREKVQALLLALPEEQREVFCLRHFEGMRFTEIAKLQEISENTVKSRMRYALRSLQEALQDYEGFSFDQEDLSAPTESQRQV